MEGLEYSGDRFLCEKLHCWISTKACELRQFRASNGMHEKRAKYLDSGCGKCEQGKMIKMDQPEKIKEKKCKGQCGKLLPLTDFQPSKNTLDGHENKCKKCRAKERKDAYQQSKINRLRAGHTYVKPPLVTGDINFVDIENVPANNQNSITIDFSAYPDLFEKVINLSKNEFRTPEMQILYLINTGLTLE